MNYYGFPVLVWKKILSFLTPHELYTLTRELSELLEIPDVGQRVNEYENMKSYVCSICPYLMKRDEELINKST